MEAECTVKNYFSSNSFWSPKTGEGSLPKQALTMFYLKVRHDLGWDFSSFSQLWQRMPSPESQVCEFVKMRLFKWLKKQQLLETDSPHLWAAPLWRHYSHNLQWSQKLRKKSYAYWKTATKHNLSSRWCYFKVKIYLLFLYFGFCMRKDSLGTWN